MGILNLTPDSFSDGGLHTGLSAVVAAAAAMIEGGADILDLGGESTRPGAAPVDAALELQRVLPAIRALRESFPGIPLSIDTSKAEVAREAVEAGADVINDVWGLTAGLTPAERLACRDGTRVAARLPNSAMARVAAELRCPVVLMHNRPAPDYGSFWDDLLLDLQIGVAIARQAGIADHQLWLDPGFGFAKTVGQNLEVIRELHRVVALGFPVVVGTSRKSTLGRVLATPVDDRLEGTAATVALAIHQGCRMIRVHDVREMARVARMVDAVHAGLSFAS